MKDYYKILGIPKNASKEDIKKAYRQRSMQYHPDKNNGDAYYTDKFKSIQEAYEILHDDSKRRNYDFARNSSRNQRTTQDGFAKQGLPDISFFKADKGAFEYGKPITFSWKCLHADLIELKPFGEVAAAESKTVKIKDFEHKSLEVKLVASNTYLRKKIESTIVLQNLTYRKLEQKIIADYQRRSGKAPQQGSGQQKDKNSTLLLVVLIFIILILLMKILMG